MGEREAKRPRVCLKKASETQAQVPAPPPPRPPKPPPGYRSERSHEYDDQEIIGRFRSRDRDEDVDSRAHAPKVSRSRVDDYVSHAHTSSSRSGRSRDTGVVSADGPAPVSRREASAPEQRQIQADSVTFDVCGQLFKVPSKLISSRPDTLLAGLLESSQDDEVQQPVFVDSDVSRFPLILDWYRYDEIHTPSSVNITALLRDAGRLKLPEEIIVNGMLRSTLKSVGHKNALSLVGSVVTQWRGFAKYLDSTLNDISQHYKRVGAKSNGGSPEDEAYDFPPWRMSLYLEEGGWSDPQNVCSAARARVLALKLEDRGYNCSFSDTELIVALPLRLRGEQLQAGAGDDEPDELAEEEAS